MTTDLINIIAQIATILALIVAIFTIKFSAIINRKQMNMSIFINYTQRYEEIMESFPSNAFHTRYDLDQILPPEDEILSLCTLKYLNMTSEEYYLWKSKYIDDKVWKIWEQEIKRTLRSPLIRRAWPKLVTEFVSYPEFINYVREIQRT